MGTKKNKRSKRLSARKVGQSKATSVNLFEVRVNRKKHDILGQRLKSDRGLPGISRSKAIQKRKKTLLQEYKRRSKSNLFVDHRLSEHGGETTLQQQQTRRLVERKRKQADVFALSTDEQDLTHHGRSIRDMERFDDINITDDETEEVAGVDGEANFGGFLTRKVPKSIIEVEEEEPQKTRKQILEEVVSKSKLMKYERQSEKQEVEELLDRVDTDLKDIWGALAKSAQQQSKKAVQESADDYDRAVRELAFERRGQPTDRMQTEKEAMEAQNAKLKRLTVEKEQRMKTGLPAIDTSLEASADYMHVPNLTHDRKVHFNLEDLEEGNTAVPREHAECDEESLSSEEQSSDSDTGDTTDMDNTTDTGDTTDSEDTTDATDASEDIVPVQGVSSELGGSPSPSSASGLNTDQLFQQFIEVGQHQSFNLHSLDQLTRLIFHQCRADPVHSGQFFKDTICNYHRAWIAAKRRPRYPSLAELLVFKLVGAVFPTSDFQHPIVTPAMLLMAQLLQKCEVKTRLEMVCGLFVCDILTEYIAKSKRYIPEMVNYLISCSGCFCNGEGKVFPPFSPKSCPVLEFEGELGEGTDMDSLPSLHSLISSLSCASTSGCSLPTSLVTMAILRHTVVLGARVMRLYRDLPSFMELFSPLHFNVAKIEEKSVPVEIQELLEAVNKEISSVATIPRTALYLRQKPKSIAFYTPKIDVVYDGHKRGGGGGAKSSRGRQKLKYKVKKEQKGALREIRKDNSFLAKEKLKETLQRDAERAKKTKQILNDLQTIQHEAKLTKVKR